MKIRALLVGGLALAMAGTCEDPTAPDTCVAAQAMTLGTATTGATADGDCSVSGDPADMYTLTLASQSVVKFAVTSDQGVSIRVRRSTGNDTTGTVSMDSPLSASYTSYTILPAGTYTIDVGITNKGGNYSITPTAVAVPTGCVTPNSTTGHMAAAVGITIDAAITSTDCPGSSNQYYGDSYDVYMTTGVLRKFTVTSSMGLNMEIHADGGAVLFHQATANNAAGTMVVTYMPTTSGRFHIDFLGIPALATGTYNLKIE